MPLSAIDSLGATHVRYPFERKAQFDAGSDDLAKILDVGWRTAILGRGQTEPRAWLAQLLANARALRRRLLDPNSPWEPFEHP